MNKKIYVVELDNKCIRTIISTDLLHIGSIIEDQDWLGTKIKGGKIIKIFR